MPTLETAIYQKLRDDPGVRQWVSGRIFLSKTPKGTDLPNIVYQCIVTQDVYSTQGASGLRMKKIQFDSYARKAIHALECSEAIRSIFQSFAGPLDIKDMQGNVVGTISVNGSIVREDKGMPFEQGTAGYVERRLLEVDFWYTETVLPFTQPGSIFPADDDSEMDDEGQP